MVWFAFATLKLCETCGAALYVASPGWLALMVQVPAATRVTVVPETVQTEPVPELNATGRPELAVAETVKGGSPYTLAASAPKVIVWAVFAIVKLRATCGAGLYVELPTWSARIVQTPIARMDTVSPETVQTSTVPELKLTGSPALEV